MPPPPTGSNLAATTALLIATVIWGMTFVVVQDALVDLPVLHLLAYRFALGALLLLPFARSRPLPWKSGAILGAALFVAYVCQTAGLLWTTPSRSAFLTGMSVLFVPLFARLVGRKLDRGPVLGGLLALAGLWALYRPDLGGTVFGLGDWLSAGCAAAFAVHMLLAERWVRGTGVLGLAGIQFLWVSFLSAPALVASPPVPQQFTAGALSAIAITGVLATAVGFGCQLYAQRRLSATRVAVILTLEPIVAALYSVFLGREAWTGATTIGGLLILGGIALAQWPRLGAPSPAR